MIGSSIQYEGSLVFTAAWQLLLQQLPCISSINTAMELCCGVFPKAGLALQKLQPHTHMYYLDASAEALYQCKSFLQQFPKYYSSAFFLQNMLESNELKLRFDLLLGNHVIDDIFLRHFLCKTQSVIKNPYCSKEVFLTTVSQAIPYYMRHGQDYLVTLCEIFNRLLKLNGQIILSEYTSCYERELCIIEWPRLRLQLFEKMNDVFLQLGFSSIRFLHTADIFQVYGWKKS